MKPYLFLLLCCFSLHLFGQVTTEMIRFNSAGVALEGTIFKPKHIEAAVVLVHGSGQETRMLTLASLLAGKGIAVLTYDKRGVGKSSGVYAGPEVGSNNIDSANLNLLALDASAAINAFRAQLPKKHGKLGLMGFSQGGWIIPIAAEINRDVRFMVVFSGPVVTTLEQLRFQFYTAGDQNFWETHSEAEAREHIRNDTDRYQFAATDPQDALGKITTPGLWLFGGRDIQIPVGLSIEHLNSLKAKGKPYEYRLFPTLGHNTAFSNSQKTVDLAIEWMKTNAKNHTFQD